MKGLRLVLVATGVLGLAACSKGSSGSAGDPGPTGTPGTLAQAPRIDFVSVPALTHNTTATVFGANLAAVTSSNGLASVLVNGHAAQIVAGDATSITFTHAVDDDPALYDTDGFLTVVVNNLGSNTLPVYLAQPGINLGLGGSIFVQANAIALGAGNSLIVDDAQTGTIDRVAANGDVATLFSSFANNTQRIWEIGANIWALDFDGSLGKYDTATGAYLKVARFSGVIDGDFDGSGNFYGLRSNDTIVQWNGTSHVTTDPFATANNATIAFNPGAITRMGTSLYITDLTNFAVVAVALADGTSTTYAANGQLATPVAGLANDGTNLFTYSAGNLTKIDNAGTSAQFSVLHPDSSAGFGRAIVADATGKVFVTAVGAFGDNWIARYSAAGATIEPWTAYSVSGAFANIGMRIFDGSMIPVTGGSSDITSGVLYESVNGTLRRVTGALDNGNFFNGVFDHPVSLKVRGGKLWAIGYDTGNISSINPDTGAVTLFYDNVTTPVIQNPEAIELDAAGNAYVSNIDPVSGSYAIAKFSAAGVLADSGWAFSPNFNEIRAIAIQGTRLVGDDANNREFWSIPLSTATGSTGTYLGDGSNGSALTNLQTYQMTTNAAGNIEFVDTYNYSGLLSLSPANELHTSVLYGNSMLYGQTDASGIVIGTSYNSQHIVVLP